MRLSDLLEYDRITVQCHDNPDADALASGWGIYEYLKAHDKDVRLIYSGRFKVTKGNLVLFIDELEIPVEFVKDNTKHVDGLLVTVDCQYGASNVTKFSADNIMIIDHHQQEIENIEKTFIRSDIGSCSTIVWSLLVNEGFDFTGRENLQTAFYYGLFTDSNQFNGIMNPLDKDMKEDVYHDESFVVRLQNSNMSAAELEVAGVAMIRSIINKEHRFAVVKAEPCDPNILGLIADLVLQVSEIDYCAVFNVLDHGIKFSTRSCIKEVKADHLARYLAKDIGSGGGHMYKAGGFIGMSDYMELYGDYDQTTYFTNKLTEHKLGYRIIDVMNDSYDLTGAKKYKKNQMRVGYVKASEILPIGAETVVRSLEGDIHVTVSDDLYIMIGIKGEIYPIREAKFNSSYVRIDEPYDIQLEYHPKAKIRSTGQEYSLLDYARSCMTTGESYVYAKPLERKGAKIFTAWDRECYMLGEVGDYIACRLDDQSDIYIIERVIFGMTYSLAED